MAGNRTLQALADATAERYGVPKWLVRNVIKNESGWRIDARSPVGAQGLMQLMPDTAAGLGVTDPLDPVQNIDGGVRYLKAQLDRFGGDVELAVAAYNAGPGNVEKYGGVPPFRETQAYVRRVVGGRKGAAAPRVIDSGSRMVTQPPRDPTRSRPDLLAGILRSNNDLLGVPSPDFESLFAAAAQSQPRPVASQPGASAASSPQPPAPGDTGAQVGLTPAFRSALDRLLEAAGGRVTVNSGFRSVDEQRRLWQDALRKYGSEAEARRWVAPPGRSFHGKGLAADLGGDPGWVRANAAKFGLYQPLPHEPWHLELRGSRG